ncbi:MAG: MBL fold metallo-hydrolase [Ignavibacteriae bacterium]|nr:MBL fold metallo-hydrolase [Ignavibacteriota bacterium]
MKKSIYFLLFSLLTANLFCQSGDTKKDLQITYIANEGFLISSGNKKILIDALFKSDYYTSPSDSTINKIIGNSAPLNNIDYLIFTHAHQDHFNEKLCAEFLKKNQKTKFLSTPEACGKLNQAETGYPDIVCCDIGYGEMKEINEEGLSITAFRLMHGTSPDIQNLAYIIKINGYTVLHVGDGFVLQNEQYLKKIEWENYNIDVLFIGYMDANNFVLETLSNTIKPKNLVLMHIHEDDIQEAKSRNEKYGAGAFIFEKELETKTFTK